jgi:hypothetical protein
MSSLLTSLRSLRMLYICKILAVCFRKIAETVLYQLAVDLRYNHSLHLQQKYVCVCGVRGERKENVFKNFLIANFYDN